METAIPVLCVEAKVQVDLSTFEAGFLIADTVPSDGHISSGASRGQRTGLII